MVRGGRNATKGEIINAGGANISGTSFDPPQLLEDFMAKGIQSSNKMTKKPKKDAPVGKTAGSDRPVAPMTAVAPKGKLKNKPA
jgi:hypothetical protein